MLSLFKGYEIPISCLVLLILIVYWNKLVDMFGIFSYERSGSEPQPQRGLETDPAVTGDSGEELEKKDSLHDKLQELAEKLAMKESKYHITKTRVMQAQNESDNLGKLSKDLKARYKEMIGSLKDEMINNEIECKKMQKQIEIISKKRAKLIAEKLCRKCAGTCKSLPIGVAAEFIENQMPTVPVQVGNVSADFATKVDQGLITVTSSKSSLDSKATISPKAAAPLVTSDYFNEPPPTIRLLKQNSSKETRIGAFIRQVLAERDEESKSRKVQCLSLSNAGCSCWKEIMNR